MWARTGNVIVTAASTTVNGGSISPMFLNNGVKPGYAFIGPDARQYEVAAVVSETSLSLVTAYLGSTASNQSYAIMQNAAAAYSETLEQVNDLLAMLTTNIPASTVSIGSPTETGAVLAANGTLMSLESVASTRFYISKGATANDCYLEFAVAKSGRGRIGLIGNNNIRIDYSTDGSTWVNIFLFDLTTSALNPRINLNFPLIPKSYTIATLPTSVAGMMVYCSDLGGQAGYLMGDGTGWKRMQDAYVNDSTSTAHSHTELTDANIVRFTGTIAADRTLTVNTTNARPGARRRYTRTGAGAFNWSINGLKNLAVNTWCDITFDGSAWYLSAYGAL